MLSVPAVVVDRDTLRRARGVFCGGSRSKDENTTLKALALPSLPLPPPPSIPLHAHDPARAGPLSDVCAAPPPPHAPPRGRHRAPVSQVRQREKGGGCVWWGCVATPTPRVCVSVTACTQARCVVALAAGHTHGRVLPNKTKETSCLATRAALVLALHASPGACLPPPCRHTPQLARCQPKGVAAGAWGGGGSHMGLPQKTLASPSSLSLCASFPSFPTNHSTAPATPPRGSTAKMSAVLGSVKVSGRGVWALCRQERGEGKGCCF